MHETHEQRLKDACHEAYPNLKKELEEQKANPGLMTFILDTMIDVELLDDEPTKQAKDAEEPTSVGSDHSHDIEKNGQA